MKLEDLIKNVFDDRANIIKNEGSESTLKDILIGTSFDSVLNSVDLEKIKDELLKTDAFSECEDLEIVHHPIFKLGEDKVLTTQTHRYGEDIKYRGKCYLYSISLTPEMYDPSKMLEPVKNGAAISPAIYNPMTFEPTKHILLTWSPEMAMDLSVTKDETTLRNDIHKLLDDVLDNPEEYRMKGTRHIMIRGVFEQINYDRKFEPDYLVGTIQESETYIGYYMVKEKGSNDKESLNIKSKQIPKKLKESFIEKFTEEGSLKETTEEELNQFLEENK
jgi:hypothetical protein